MVEGKGATPKIVESKASEKPGPSNEDNEEKEVTKWKHFTTEVHSLSRPFMQKHNTLPPDPTNSERLKYAFSCPPHGKVSNYLIFLLNNLFFFISLICYKKDDFFFKKGIWNFKIKYKKIRQPQRHYHSLVGRFERWNIEFCS